MNAHTRMIAAVISTLDKVEVKGEANLDRLLGCILELRKLKEALEHEADNQPQ